MSAVGYQGSDGVAIVEAGVVGQAAEGVVAIVALVPGRIVAAGAGGLDAALGVGRCDGRAGICSHNDSSFTDRLLSLGNAHQNYSTSL